MNTEKRMRGTGAGFWGWRALFLVLTVNFLATVGAILAGDFDEAGLPPRMLPMEIFNNGIEALLWLAVLVLSLMKRPRIAPELCVFLAGFLWFDVLTTHPLVMPLPPGFLWWGSALAVIMLVAGRTLVMRRMYAGDSERRDALLPFPATADDFRKTIWLFAVLAFLFAATVWSLLKGDYDQTGLPLVVLPWHAVANGIEALLWLGAATLIWKGSAREAGWVGLFAAGMFSWDALTTAFLPNMPIPWQAVWSPVVICVMLAATNGLRKV
ncbi:MAG: hypothetical protein A3I66_04670 [Burkholderiales bacterium RIFCSPLOWO2_02_FULL_57_36]|nr:MAG: hypothetical protein A3I66_04670 [Burkholderiales bacterium RIFCSPLOWO2_02_FULL_57_36]